MPEMSPQSRAQPQSEACVVCGTRVDAADARALNVWLAPLHQPTSVVGAVHWPCLAPIFQRVTTEAGAGDAFVALFGDSASAA
jgi:hypothetical protein